MSAETNEPWTVRRIVRFCADDFEKRGVESPRLDGELIVAHALGCDRVHLYMDLDRELDEAALARVRELVRRRRKREPMAYLLGEKEFWGRSFVVSPAVLVPRPDTETLVECALALFATPRVHDAPREGSRAGDADDASDEPEQRELEEGASTHVEPIAATEEPPSLGEDAAPAVRVSASARVAAAPRVLDVGTGSGAIGLTLALEWPDARVTLVDLSDEALAVARENLHRFAEGDPSIEARVQTLEGDLFAPLSAEDRFELIVSNPPYLSEAELGECAVDVREHEPRLALVGGPRGDEVLARLIEGARALLSPGGTLLVEIGSTQGSAVARLFEEAGYEGVRVHRDLAGHDRVVEGRVRSESPAAASR